MNSTKFLKFKEIYYTYLSKVIDDLKLIISSLYYVSSNQIINSNIFFDIRDIDFLTEIQDIENLTYSFIILY